MLQFLYHMCLGHNVFLFYWSLTLPVPCISESCIKIINLNFYFRTSLWWLKRFYEGFTGYLWKQLNKTHSNILDKYGSTEIGLKCPNLERPPPLKTGVTLAIYKSSGKILFPSDTSNINFKGPYSSPKLASIKMNICLYIILYIYKKSWNR